jgi:hypothetical protein
MNFVLQRITRPSFSFAKLFVKKNVLYVYTDGSILFGSPVVTICTTYYNTLKLCILTTECICVFRMVLTINRDCFPKQH